MRSLRARLFVVWALALASACAVGFLLVQLYRQSADAQIARAEAAVAHACERIGDSYAYYTTGWTPHLPAAEDASLRADLKALVGLALAETPGMQGGIWQSQAGLDQVPLATTGAAPIGETRDRIAALNEAAEKSGRPEADRIGAGAQTVLVYACPLRGPLPGATGWTLLRVTAIAGSSDLQAGVAVLLALVLALAGVLAWLLLTWARHVGRIEAALAAADNGVESGALPPLALTGEAELDRIVTALNTAGARLATAHRRSEELSARVAVAERLAALGRVAAGVAHEIRNPIAAMRLRAENALAGDDARRRAALEAILAQIARLDRLLGELLTMTQRREPRAEPVDVSALLAAAAADHRQDRIGLRVEASAVLPAVLDPALLRRTLDALLDNALRHTPEHGEVTLRACRDGEMLRIDVADSGPGIAPEVQKSLFEPFVSGRADGTGLGLAIARELAEAQGARLTLASAGGGADGDGAVFRLELACPAS